MVCVWLFIRVWLLRGLKCRQGAWEFPSVPKFQNNTLLMTQTGRSLLVPWISEKNLPAGPSQLLPHGVGTPVIHLPEEQSWSCQGCAAPQDSSLITQGLNGVCW